MMEYPDHCEAVARELDAFVEAVAAGSADAAVPTQRMASASQLAPLVGSPPQDQVGQRSLASAGFDAAFAAAWLIEGLLTYLTAQEAAGLLAAVTELSSPAHLALRRTVARVGRQGAAQVCARSVTRTDWLALRPPIRIPSPVCT